MEGKAKIDFEQWYDNEFNGYEYLSHRIKRIKSRFHFWDMPNCFQQGVLLQFFRERGIEIENEFNLWDEKEEYNPKYKFVVWQYLDKGKYKRNNGFTQFTDPDYSTAFTHAIDKACEIINGKKN